MFGLWDVLDVGVRDVGCGMFIGMWDVDLQNASTRQCPRRALEIAFPLII